MPNNYKTMNYLKNFYKNNTKKNLNKWEHYFDIYDENFFKFRNTKITILEIGVFRGGSLKMWQNYFGPDTKIIGIDIDPLCKQYEDNNIKIYIGDQTEENFLQSILKENDNPDIIIDDGGHTSNQQISSFNFLYENLNLGGIYLVEDTHTSYSKDFQDREDNLTFTEYAKILSDELNDWYRVQNYKFYKQKIDQVEVSYWAKFIYRISFYNSIVAIEKRKSKIPFSQIK